MDEVKLKNSLGSHNLLVSAQFSRVGSCPVQRFTAQDAHDRRGGYEVDLNCLP